MTGLRLFTISCVLVLSLIATAPAVGQQPQEEVVITTVPVAEGVHMLVGRGGNIGVSAGEDGVFLVDDQFAPLTEKIKAAVAEIGEGPVRFVINTHWHGDHVGGNENLGGEGALIVAHDNVRQRMSTEQFMEAFNRTVPPSPRAALPVVTFAEGVTFHLNGDEIHAFHVPTAHTDGDSIIHFKSANAIHMGDVMFNGMYPFIDLGSGGSVDGAIAAVEKVLEMADGETKIIPGHGELAGRADLETYVGMLKGARAAVAALVAEGKSADEVVAAKPTALWDEKWGGGFINPERFVRTIYASLTAD